MSTSRPPWTCDWIVPETTHPSVYCASTFSQRIWMSAAFLERETMPVLSFSSSRTSTWTFSPGFAAAGSENSLRSTLPSLL